MKLRSVVSTVLFGAALAASHGALDSLTITKVEDIHITDPEAATKIGVMEPNNGNAKLLQIQGFKC